jgi:hypothetical protein
MTGLCFQPEELAQVQALIRDQWLQRIAEVSPPQVAKRFEAIELNRYHELSDTVDHKSLWSKGQRILSPHAVAKIRQTSLIRALEREFGSFEISDEENVGHEEIYWRLVRPNNPGDVGPLHADEWFWSLGHGVTPPGVQRVKVWVAICCDPGKNGFRFVPGSHKKQWRYHGDLRGGFVKPQIDEDEKTLNIKIFDSNPGDAIVFHDRLLHAGVVGGPNTRVSIEFTMFVKNENYFN